MRFGYTYSCGYKLVRVEQLTRAHSLESLMEGHNWFLNQLVRISRRSIIVCFVFLLAKVGLNRTLFEISCSWPPAQGMAEDRLYIALSRCGNALSDRTSIHCTLAAKYRYLPQGWESNILPTWVAPCGGAYSDLGCYSYLPRNPANHGRPTLGCP